MSEDVEVFGATVGDISHIVVYYDVSTGNLYNSNGGLYGNNALSTFLDNEFTLELHYVEDISTSEQPEDWKVWDGLDGKTVSSTLAFDNDYAHSILGNVSSPASVSATEISISIPSINLSTLSATGRLFINPYGDASDKIIVSYSSFTRVTGTNIYTFTINEPDGLPIDVPVDTLVRIEAPLLFSVNSNTIYEANVPNRFSEGVFNIPITVSSRKLLSELDSTGKAYISGLLEHNIYVKQNKLSGISVSGSTLTLVRDNEYDVYASSDGINTELFCYWSDGTISYWTRGNSISNGNALYLIDGSSASLQGITADPVYDTDIVLFRTFTIPFVVKNLVQYTPSYDIPFEEIDWSTDYIVSVVKNNIGSIGGGTGSGASYSFNTNEFSVGSVVSIKTIDLWKINGLSEVISSLDDAIDTKQARLTTLNAGEGISITEGADGVLISLVGGTQSFHATPIYENLGITGSTYSGGTSIEKNTYYTASSSGYVYVVEDANTKININGATLSGIGLYPIQENAIFRIENSTASTIFARFDGDAVEYAFAPTVTIEPITRTSETVTLTATWSSNVAQKFYRVGESGTWVVYTRAIKNINSNETYYFKAIDVNGMESVILVPVTNIVPVAPTVTSSSSQQTSDAVVLSITWGADSIGKQYKIEKNGTVIKDWSSCGNTVTASANAVYSFRSKKENGAYYSDITGFTVSNLTAPVVTLSGYNNSTPTETTSITASTRTGVPIKWRKGSSGSWTNYTSPVTVISNGTYNFLAVDIAGSTGTKSVTFSNISDLTPPVLTLTYNNITPDLQSDLLTATTNETATIYYMKEGDSSWSTYTEPILIQENGTYYLKATDTAGNTCDIQTVVYTNIAGGHVTPPEGDVDPED